MLILPADEDEIRGAVMGLRIAPLLRGWRGRPGGDVDAAVDTIMKVQKFALDHQRDLAELDINPLIVAEQGCCAVDAMIRTRKGAEI